MLSREPCFIVVCIYVTVCIQYHTVREIQIYVYADNVGFINEKLIIYSCTSIIIIIIVTL